MACKERIVGVARWVPSRHVHILGNSRCLRNVENTRSTWSTLEGFGHWTRSDESVEEALGCYYLKRSFSVFLLAMTIGFFHRFVRFVDWNWELSCICRSIPVCSSVLQDDRWQHSRLVPHGCYFDSSPRPTCCSDEVGSSDTPCHWHCNECPSSVKQ